MTLTLVPQRDGSSFQWSNCNCACGAMLVSFATSGDRTPTAAEVRALVRNSDGSPDRSGGTTSAQVADAIRRGYGVLSDVRYAVPFDLVWARGNSPDWAVSLSGHYGVVSHTKYDGSPGFTGNHQVVFHAGMIYDPLADGRRPGIPLGPKRWGKTLIRAFAATLNVGPPGTTYHSLGDGKAYATFVQPIPRIHPSLPPHAVPGTVFRYGGEARFRGDYRVRRGVGAARVRSKPQIPAGEIVSLVPAEQELPFHVSQSTELGSSVQGNRQWFGDATGNQWISATLVEAM
jgi:hypothetical protein